MMAENTMQRVAKTVLVLLLLAGPLHAQQPAPRTPPPAAAQDEFRPVDSPINPQDAMPAPRLVAIAYGFIWLLFFGYLASVQMRLSRVQREMEVVSRRVTSGRKQS
jgi:CcmD family protein